MTQHAGRRCSRKRKGAREEWWWRAPCSKAERGGDAGCGSVEDTRCNARNADKDGDGHGAAVGVQLEVNGLKTTTKVTGRWTSCFQVRRLRRETKGIT